MIVSFMLLLIVFRNVHDSIKRYSLAVVSWVTYAYFLIEVLSLINKINIAGLLTGWGMLFILLLSVLAARHQFYWGKEKILSTVIHKIKDDSLFFLIAVVTFVLALGTVPYNWDSMTYHMTRIAHWAQNQSIAHFATNNTRQVASPVLASFINLQVYVLCGKKDILCNLLQWSCYVTNGCLVYGIAKRIGCNDKFARISRLLFMTMPIAFAEALTTQVDHFATVWLLIFSYFLLDFTDVQRKIKFDKASVIDCIVLSVCVAYGYLAKSSVSIAMLLFAIGILIICIKRRDSFGEIIKLILLAVPIMIILVAPEIIRNIITFNAINPPNVGQRQLVGTLRPNYLFVNFLKNFTFNLPNIYIYKSEKMLYAIVSLMAVIMRVDINHPSIAEDGKVFYLHEPQTYGHDTAINPVIILLMIVCAAWCIYRFIKGKAKATHITGWSILTFVIFCGILRWEPFVSRYMLSYLAILCPVICVQLQDMSDHFTFIRPFVYFVCLVELFGMLWYHGRTMKDSWRDGYYVNHSGIMEEYNEVGEIITKNGAQNVGLCLGGDDYEYPIWAYNKSGSQFEYINVTNETARYEVKDYIPDIIITSNIEGQVWEYKDNLYELDDACQDNQYLCVYTIK